MKILEDIQRNTSEFNIKFHLQEFVGMAMMMVFMVEENRKKMEDLMKMEFEPADFKATVIGHAFEELASMYLSEPIGSDEEDEESEEV